MALAQGVRSVGADISKITSLEDALSVFMDSVLGTVTGARFQPNVTVGEDGRQGVPGFLHPVDAEQLVIPGKTGAVFPVAGGTFSDSFGDARSGGRRHQGQDIFAAKGTPVISATSGKVVRVGTGGLGGKTVTIQGEDGNFYYYAHLDRHAKIAPGDAIKAGTQVGTVGTSGNAAGTPPHLHFSVNEGRKSVKNPAQFLQGLQR